MSPVVSEEDLIAHVLRIKLTSDVLSNAQTHAALVAEGVDCELGQVKKAASKAAKRVATPAVPTPPPPLAPKSDGPSKQEQKRANAAAEAMKAAELAMMTALKACHQERWMVALHGTQAENKAFINQCAALAISGALAPGEALGKERVEADVATLQYLLLPGSPFELPEEERRKARTQLDKLEDFQAYGKGKGKTVGGVTSPFVSQPTFQGARAGFVFKTGPLGLGYYHEAWFAAASACYVAPPAAAQPAAEAEEPEAPPVDPALREICDQIKRGDSSSVDRAMVKAAALASNASGGGSAMDDMD